MFPIESCAKQQIYVHNMPEEGCVLQFESNSTATSDGCEQKHQEQTVPQNDISNHFSMLYITALDDYMDLSPQLITGFN